MRKDFRLQSAECRFGERSSRDAAPSERLEVQSPVALAILDYRRHGSRKFRRHLREHLANGYVISTPALFMMFKAVALECRGVEIVAWYITYSRGEKLALLAQLPFPLPYIAFKRLRHGRERLRVYPFDKFREICNRKSAICN